jgi:hypothetical protein
MKTLLGTAIALAALLCAPPVPDAWTPSVPAAWAQEDPREAEMFGTPDDPRETEMFGDPDEEPKQPADPTVLERYDAEEGAREDALFGGRYDGDRLTDRETELLTREKLQVGGMLYLRYTASGYSGDEFDPAATMPNLLDLYVDGRPNDRLRGFVKGRLHFDPVTSTAFPGMPQGAVEKIQAYANTLKEQPGVPQEALEQLDALTRKPDPARVALDQFWLKFDLARRLYVTVGKQPIHWGTTRVWNPVDVVNSTRREPLALFDERTGVTALKLHLPIESIAWNVVGLLLLDDADAMSEIGAALRLETVFSTVEMGLSGMVRNERQADGSDLLVPKIGLDFSAGIWDFDLTGEVAASFEDKTRLGDFALGDRELLLQAAAGLQYTLKYSAEDFLVAGIEYFFNPDGYSDKSTYASLYTTPGAFTPFYLGQHYGACFVSLPGPGTWDYTSFTLSNVANFSDGSMVSRFDFSVTVLTYLSIQTYAQVHLGEEGGEFRFKLDEAALFPDSPEIPAPLFTVGLNLRIDI